MLYAGFDFYRVMGHHPPCEGAPAGWRHAVPIRFRVLMPSPGLGLGQLWPHPPAHLGNAPGTRSRRCSHLGKWVQETSWSIHIAFSQTLSTTLFTLSPSQISDSIFCPLLF